MDKVFDPEIGLLIWEVLTFAALIFLLGRFGRKPLADALKQREDKIHSDIERAGRSAKEAEALKSNYEQQISSLAAWTREQMTQTEKEMEKIREEMRITAERDSARIFENANRQLLGEQEELVRQLRSSTALLSLNVAEECLRRMTDKNLQEDLLGESLEEIGKAFDGASQTTIKEPKRSIRATK